MKVNVTFAVSQHHDGGVILLPEVHADCVPLGFRLKTRADQSQQGPRDCFTPINRREESHWSEFNLQGVISQPIGLCIRVLNESEISQREPRISFLCDVAFPRRVHECSTNNLRTFFRHYCAEKHVLLQVKRNTGAPTSYV